MWSLWAAEGQEWGTRQQRKQRRSWEQLEPSQQAQGVVCGVPGGGEGQSPAEYRHPASVGSCISCLHLLRKGASDSTEPGKDR